MKWTANQCWMFTQENDGRLATGKWLKDGSTVKGTISTKYEYEPLDPYVVLWGSSVYGYRVDPDTIEFLDGQPERAPSAPGNLGLSDIGKTAHCGARGDDWFCTRPVGHPPTVHVAHWNGVEVINHSRWPVHVKQTPTPIDPVTVAYSEMSLEKTEEYKRGPLLIPYSPAFNRGCDPYTGLSLAEIERLRDGGDREED